MVSATKITDVKAYALEHHVGRPVTGFRSYYDNISSIAGQRFSAVYVKISTDEGIAGWGEAIAREAPSAAASVINDLFRPLLLGRDPLDHLVLWEELFSLMRVRGHFAGYYVEALSGIDLALWDIKGKYLNKPVSKLLGGVFRDRVKAYASSVVFMDPRDAVKEVTRLLEEGFRYVKIKIGRGFERDREVIKAIRDSLGSGIEIMADANTAYNAATAIRVGRMLERYDAIWFEEPVPPDSVDAYAEISRTLDIPIAAAETLFTKYQWVEFMRRRAMDIAMPDIARVGGITEAIRIAALADSFDIPVTFHIGLSGAGCRAATLQLAASLPSHLLFTPAYEYYYVERNPLAYQVVVEPVEVFEGDDVIIPSRPGLGLEIDEARLKNYIT